MLNRLYFLIVVVALTVSCAVKGDMLSATIRSHAMENDIFELSYTPARGDQMLQPLARLKDKLKEMGYTIQEVENLDAFGKTSRQFQLILLDSGMEPNGQFEVLAHEAGHLFHPYQMMTPFAEAFAESVAVRLGNAQGYDSSYAAGVYLSQYREGLDAMELYEKEIRHAVNILLGREEIPDWLKPQSQENRSQD